MTSEYKLIIPVDVNEYDNLSEYLPNYLSHILGACTGMITAAPDNSHLKIYIEIDVINIKLAHTIFDMLKRKNLTLEIFNMNDKFDKIKFSFNNEVGIDV